MSDAAALIKLSGGGGGIRRVGRGGGGRQADGRIHRRPPAQAVRPSRSMRIRPNGRKAEERRAVNGWTGRSEIITKRRSVGRSLLVVGRRQIRRTCAPEVSATDRPRGPPALLFATSDETDGRARRWRGPQSAGWTARAEHNTPTQDLYKRRSDNATRFDFSHFFRRANYPH